MRVWIEYEHPRYGLCRVSLPIRYTRRAKLPVLVRGNGVELRGKRIYYSEKGRVALYPRQIRICKDEGQLKPEQKRKITAVIMKYLNLIGAKPHRVWFE